MAQYTAPLRDMNFVVCGVRNRIKLIGAEDKGNGRTLLTTENTFEIDAADKPALIAQALSMVLA